MKQKMPSSFSSVNGIVPPHILREILSRGTEQQRNWAFRTLTHTERLRGHREVFAGIQPLVPAGEKRRTIYDAVHGMELPGKLVRGEGEPKSKDIAVNEAYDAAGTVYDFYRLVLQRNSIDGRGMRLDSTVHYEEQYDNAFWNGVQMVYGDGDGQIFQRFTKAIDVIGHELTHGVTQFEAGLNYQGQSGALNESMSDVFGSLVKQWILKQKADKADWLIGAGLLAPKVKGVALRSMKAPGTAYNDRVLGKDPQPDHMDHFYNGSMDNGGVHINSGIPNRAFYLAAVEMGGFAWEKTGKIWYHALCGLLRPNADFAQCAKATIKAADELYGKAEKSAVQNAWEKVGVV